MIKPRIFVHVVGFSDTERHALNTVFRLSEERQLAYTAWAPLSDPTTTTNHGLAEVVLVDGDSSEAVLVNARPTPPGQRLIWVGANAPAHAWRLVERPIQWASVLNELDAVFAAVQADSGLLDLDVTNPSPLELGPSTQVKRALIVGTSHDERATVTELLQRAGVMEIDLAATTELALEALNRNRYACGVFDLDQHDVDTWQLSRLFAQRFPQSLTMGISEHAGPLAPWLRRRRVKQDTQKAGITAVVARPLEENALRRWIELLR